MTKPIIIAGGGLAGLALGIGLRRRGVPVTVIEADGYPRHRVCGEFISGRGQETLRRLGLLEAVEQAGMRPAATAAFFDGATRFPPRRLPQPAWCISRYVLDDLLARQFVHLGGALRTGERESQLEAEGVVRTTGRRPERVVNGWRWFGLKVHACGVTLEADLEMHLFPSGYVGLCRLSEGRVNVCGLFRSKGTVPGLAAQWREYLGGPPGSALAEKLAGARFDEVSFCAVAGISTVPHRAADRPGCTLGDAIAVIPPVSGNGMSMALESAELALDPLTEYSRGATSWEPTRRIIARACDQRFAGRLRRAVWLQAALFHPGSRQMVCQTAARVPSFWRAFFTLTR